LKFASWLKQYYKGVPVDREINISTNLNDNVSGLSSSGTANVRYTDIDISPAISLDEISESKLHEMQNGKGDLIWKAELRDIYAPCWL